MIVYESQFHIPFGFTCSKYQVNIDFHMVRGPTINQQVPKEYEKVNKSGKNLVLLSHDFVDVIPLPSKPEPFTRAWSLKQYDNFYILLQFQSHITFLILRDSPLEDDTNKFVHMDEHCLVTNHFMCSLPIIEGLLFYNPTNTLYVFNGKELLACRATSPDYTHCSQLFTRVKKNLAILGPLQSLWDRSKISLVKYTPNKQQLFINHKPEPFSLEPPSDP